MILDVGSVKDFLGIVGIGDDARVQAAAGHAEGMAARYCGRQQFESTWFVKTFNLDNYRTRVIVPVRPIVAPVNVTFSDEGFAFMDADVTTGTPGSITFVDHGLGTGDGPFRFMSTTGPNLPTPINTATDYWVIAVDANTIRLALSEADATAGTAISITSTNGGFHRIIGPFLDRSDVVVEALSGIVSLRGGVQWPRAMVTLVWRAGLCENGDDAPDDLFGALVEQAAYRYLQAGTSGRLGESGQEKPSGVRSTYVTTDWAPGILAVLDSYRLRNL